MSETMFRVPPSDACNDVCHLTESFPESAKLRCERKPKHTGKHLGRDHDGRRTEWWQGRPDA